MKIEQISVYSIQFPLITKFQISGGRFIESLDSTLVAIDTDVGIRGWGEACPWGTAYSPAFALGLRAGLEEISTHLIGLDPRRTDVVYQAMNTVLAGHAYIKSAIDIACWDILGQATNLPICDLLGGRVDQKIPLKTSVSLGTPEQVLQSIAWGKDKGHTIHSCKVGAGVAQDIQLIRAVSNEMPTSDSILFDANGAWLTAEALQIMNSIKQPIAGFEQPCKSYGECLLVRQQTAHPVLLDESIQSYSDAIRAHGDSACDGFNLKVGRLGGLTPAKRIRDFCIEVGLRLNFGETGGSALADTAVMHLAQSTPASHLQSGCLIHEMLDIDCVVDGARNQGGYTSAPAQPGLGAKPDFGILGKPTAVYR